MKLILGVPTNFKIKEAIHWCGYTSTYDTGIDVNAGWKGLTILVISSGHGGTGDETYSQIDMIRCGYTENHYHVIPIAQSGNLATQTYDLSSNNTLVFKARAATIGCYVLYITSKLL